ncbi:hypothetical protein MASR2M48_08860 [Spirochaetota bacterium]
MKTIVNWPKAIPRFIQDIERFLVPPLYYITFPDLLAGISPAGGHIFIGAAVINWSNGNFIKRCGKCNALVYVLLAGSALSGLGTWKAMCPKCGLITKNVRTKDMIINSDVKGKWNTLGFKPLVQAADPCFYTPEDGLVYLGDKKEIRIAVPSWLDFMKENYPEYLK